LFIDALDVSHAIFEELIPTVSGSEPFPHRLLNALTADSMLEDAEALCGEAWVRMGNAVRASVIRIAGPDELSIHDCRFESGASVRHDSSRISARFSTILNSDVLKSLVPSIRAGEHRRVTSIPIQGWAVVADFQGDQTNNEAADSELSDTVLRLSHRLLTRSPVGPCQFPDARHLESMAEFAAGAGHEINNPLGSILGQTALLLKNETSIERRQALESIGGQAWRIRDMIGNTMLFARPPKPQKVSLDVEAAATDVISSIQEKVASDRIRIRLTSGSSCANIRADAAQFRSLLSYLIRNSTEAIGEPPSAAGVDVTIRRNDQHRAVELSVVDTGRTQISATVCRHMFDPFFSGRSAGRGLGFGLSLAWQIVRQHDGVLFCFAPQQGGLQSHAALPY
jgi:signal transduction histidine kinase